ncbi:putative membrane protein, partial [Dysosmobacter welbionis]
EVGLLHHHHKAVPGDAGIVHQNVNPAEFLHSGIHQGLHLGLVRHVALHGQGLGTQVLASGHGLLGSFRPAGVAQHHIGAAPGQLLADGPADAPAAAGDHGGLSSKIHHAFSFISCSSVSGRFSTSAAVSTAQTGMPG